MIEELLSQSWTQWVALTAGILYVILAARENIACWIFGIISCAAIAWDDFTSFKLYADGVLQLIYVAMGIWGLWQWSKSDDPSGMPITKRPSREHAVAIILVALISWPVSIVLNTYTDASFGYLDTLTTVLSLYATWLLIQKVLGNWLYWIAIDAVYVGLFFRTGGKLVSVLYVIFLVVAVYGYFEWRGRLRKQLTIKKPSK